MEYIKQSMTFELNGPTALSLGKFDGLHKGHGLLLEYMEAKKREHPGLKSVAFTFDVPPREQMDGHLAQVLTTNPERARLLGQAGVDYLVECPFTEEIRCMEPEVFIETIVKNLRVAYLVAGADFRFGHNRRGDHKMLMRYADKLGYQAKVVEKRQKDGRDISSTYIREEISGGNIELANELLGYHYFVDGIVVSGRKMGKAVLGIPTINLLPPEEKLLPPFGVYVTETECGGLRYPGITNVGRKPTIAGSLPVGVETHLFDVSKDMYGKEVRVSFLKRVRAERKFGSLEALKAQMEQDIQYGVRYFTQE